MCVCVHVVCLHHPLSLSWDCFISTTFSVSFSLFSLYSRTSSLHPSLSPSLLLCLFAPHPSYPPPLPFLAFSPSPAPAFPPEQGREEGGTSAMTPDKINAISVIKRLLENITRRQTQMDDLWRERRGHLEQTLELRVFEKALQKVRLSCCRPICVYAR